MVRIAMRRLKVLAALGVSNSTFYDGIAKGLYPPPTKIDPEGRISVWWEDEIEAVQKRAVERTAQGRAQAAA
jgi:predicted DNA-binding transcriptional regulator AlpA